MAPLRIEIVDERIPGAAPVSAHSLFAAVTDPCPAQASVVAPPASSTGLTDAAKVTLDGEWFRRALPDDPDPSPLGASFDDLEWDRVFVPNNFGLEPGLSAHFGPVFYRRRLAPLDAPHCQLVFDAVDYLADVWLDGDHLGHHEGYFAPFAFDVSGRQRAGAVLTVRVQDPFEDWPAEPFFVTHPKRAIKGTLKYHDSRPGGLPGRGTPGWTPRLGQSLTTGGITGSVNLRGSGLVRIDALFVTPIDHQRGRVHVALVMTNLTGAEAEASVTLRLTPPANVQPQAGALAVRLAPGANRVDTRITIDNPTLWWPASHRDLGEPALYKLRASLELRGRVSDQREERFGLRVARVEGEPKCMLLNGRPIFVQAANYIPRQHFADVDVEFYRRDMRLAAAAHLNSVGVHGHLQCPACYEAADEEGILVFQDFALQWHYDSGAKTNPGFIDTASRQVAEMAYLYWNHPSIVYWACHNEPMAMFFPDKPADPELDPDNQVLDEALEARMRTVEPIRHVHRASGIGDDLHLYDGSLSGRCVYDVRRHHSWFVSEFGFWTLGPHAHRWNEQGWPPDDFQIRNWMSRLSFGPSTMNYAGLPERYPHFPAWQQATELYGAFLAKYQTEWFRIRRGNPFNAYRWHFFADWWGWAGGGLLDVDREPKATYHALAAASRPVLVCTSLPNTVFAPGTKLQFPIHGVNEERVPVRLRIGWRWLRAPQSIVIGADSEVFLRYPFSRPTENSMVAVPAPGSFDDGEPIAAGDFEASVAAESSQLLSTLDLELPAQEFSSATLVLGWGGGESNWYHVLAAPPGWFCGPGAFVVRSGSMSRLGQLA